MMDLNDGMEMDQIDYYEYDDEDVDQSGESNNSPGLFNQQYLNQQQIAQVQAMHLQPFPDSSEGITDSIGISGSVPGLEGYEFMEEELDNDYNPTQQEIREYAGFLGMNINHDQEHFYNAKEGLKAPLPSQWKPCKSPGGTVYYYNFEGKQLQKEHPCDDHYRQLYLDAKDT